MSNVEIKKVESKKDLNDFIKCQWKFYEGNPNWVPPLLMDRKHILSKTDNPFFLHAEADYFLAYKNGEIVGRIAAIKNDRHTEIHKDNTGFFGFFESIDDKEVAHTLFDTAAAWLKERGLSNMRGPANPSSNDDWGWVIKGYDDPPRMLMPYNPPYYHALAESYGLKKAKDLYAYKLENKKVLGSEKMKRVQELSRKRYGLKIRALNKKDFKEELNRFKYIYNKAWQPNWGFVPLTDAEIDSMAKDFKPLVVPDLVLFGEIGDELVGAALVVPDYNFIFKQMNGKLFPFNFIKLYTQRKSIPWARIITLGIVPEHQRKGFDSVFYYEIVTRAERNGILLGEASWVLEDNTMMNRGAEVLNAERYKEYRVYDYKL